MNFIPFINKSKTDTKNVKSWIFLPEDKVTIGTLYQLFVLCHSAVDEVPHI